MTRPADKHLVIVQQGFDYSHLQRSVAEHARCVAGQIRQRMRTTLEEIVAVGDALLSVRETLPHGQFGPWIRGEFGWTDRTARNFMAVADTFGKLEIVSDLGIQPTAAYLLAAPSIPEEVRQMVIDRARAGERITAAAAKEIVARARKRSRRRAGSAPDGHLTNRLVQALERFRDRCEPSDVPGFARALREFADTLDRRPRAPRRPRTDPGGRGTRKA